jgi:hypothetical protein
MLTDGQIKEIAPKMGIPLEWIGFKSDLPSIIKPNRSYIVNLDNETDLDGDANEGTHWTCFQVMDYPNGKAEAMYFDSYGISPPEIVKKYIKKSFGITYVPYTSKDIQSMMSNACGYYCMAFLHFINKSPYRSGKLFDDTERFLSMFLDLSKSNDFKQNEYILKHFFLSKDPSKRKEVDVLKDVEFEANAGDDTMPVAVNYISK